MISEIITAISKLLSAMYLVKAGRRTCNPENKSVRQVPATVLDEVLALLAADGRDADGKPLA